MQGLITEQEAARQAAVEAIRILGGPAAAARRLGVKDHRHQTVQSWLKTRVPAEYCPLIAHETRELGEPITCMQLRPDIRWDLVTPEEPRVIEPSTGFGDLDDPNDDYEARLAEYRAYKARNPEATIEELYQQFDDVLRRAARERVRA